MTDEKQQQDSASGGDPPSEAEKALKEFEDREREKCAPSGEPAFSPTVMIGGFFRNFFKIRNEPTVWGKAFMAIFCIGLVLLVWYLATLGAPEERLVSNQVLGSPAEVFGSFHSLWFDRALTRNLAASLWRVIQGFALAVIIAVPLGILCGTFKRIDAFFAPISIFGRNIPIVTLVPITLMWFGLGEGQKIAFIFFACFAFVLFDAARSISDVEKDYLDTAYTLGASRAQVITKVLVPLALPDIFNSMRLLFGLAFGYIILAEMIDMNSGIGKLILVSQRRGPREHVYLILIIITIVAFLIDRLLFTLQRYLFPYRYGR